MVSFFKEVLLLIIINNISTIFENLLATLGNGTKVTLIIYAYYKPVNFLKILRNYGRNWEANVTAM